MLGLQDTGILWLLWPFAEGILPLYSCFSFAVCLLVPRTPRSVLENPPIGEIAEFVASKLCQTIVTYHNVWDSLSCKLTFQLLYDSARIRAMKMVDFLEV